MQLQRISRIFINQFTNQLIVLFTISTFVLYTVYKVIIQLYNTYIGNYIPTTLPLQIIRYPSRYTNIDTIIFPIHKIRKNHVINFDTLCAYRMYNRNCNFHISVQLECSDSKTVITLQNQQDFVIYNLTRVLEV